MATKLITVNINDINGENNGIEIIRLKKGSRNGNN